MVELSVPAIEVNQGSGQRLYTFAVDGKKVPSFATVSRIRRPMGVLEGYQRPEVLSHIAEIRRYLESPAPMVPNAIVIVRIPEHRERRFRPIVNADSGIVNSDSGDPER